MSKVLLKSNNKTYSLESIDTWYETNMTSNTAPSPFVASASGHYGAGYEAYKAFNGTAINASDTWIGAGNTKTGWVQIDYGVSSPRIANILELKGRNSSVLTDNVKDFNILGSNDNSIFKTLAEIRNQKDWQAIETRRYSFNNDKPYRYYRIQVLDNNGYNYVAIGDILFSYDKTTLFQVPVLSVSNFIKYGEKSINKLDTILKNKNYILQDEVSENEEGLWTTRINRKPLSISFK